VKEEHYGHLVAAFMAVLDNFHGPAWPAEERLAWSSFFGALAGLAHAVYANTGAHLPPPSVLSQHFNVHHALQLAPPTAADLEI
jgi:hypothetical protein